MDGPLKEGDSKIIATQGPLPGTTVDFWRMISEFNVTLIVSTCSLKEKNRVKCNKFWPELAEEGTPLMKALNEIGISVRKAAEDIELLPSLVLRKFDVSDSVIGFENRRVV